MLLTRQTIAIVTNDVMKMTIGNLIGNLFDIIIVAATDKICSTGPSKFKTSKLLEIVVSLRNRNGKSPI